MFRHKGKDSQSSEMDFCRNTNLQLLQQFFCYSTLESYGRTKFFYIQFGSEQSSYW